MSDWKEDVTLVYDDGHTIKAIIKGDYYSDELAGLFQISLEAAEIDYKDVKKVIFFYHKDGGRVINLVTKE